MSSNSTSATTSASISVEAPSVSISCETPSASGAVDADGAKDGSGSGSLSSSSSSNAAYSDNAMSSLVFNDSLRTDGSTAGGGGSSYSESYGTCVFGTMVERDSLSGTDSVSFASVDFGTGGSGDSAKKTKYSRPAIPSFFNLDDLAPHNNFEYEPNQASPCPSTDPSPSPSPRGTLPRSVDASPASGPSSSRLKSRTRAATPPARQRSDSRSESSSSGGRGKNASPSSQPRTRAPSLGRSPSKMQINTLGRSGSEAVDWRAREILNYCRSKRNLGTAYKTGSRRADSSWRKRRFEVKNGLLKYYKRGGIRHSEALKGTICLDRCSMRTIIGEIGGRSHCFDLLDRTSGRVFLLSVDSDKDLSMWKTVLMNHKQFCKFFPDRVERPKKKGSEDLSKKLTLTGSMRAKIMDPLGKINFDGLSFGSSDDEDNNESGNVEGEADKPAKNRRRYASIGAMSSFNSSKAALVRQKSSKERRASASANLSEASKTADAAKAAPKSPARARRLKILQGGL